MPVSERQNLLAHDDAQKAKLPSQTNDSTLNDSQLDEVAGGTLPHAVNQQITDSVTHANVKNPNAPPIAFSDMFKFLNSHRNTG